MAWKLQGADPLAATCVVVSLDMLDRFAGRDGTPQAEPMRPRVRLFRGSELFNPHPDCLAEITIEPPYLPGALRVLSGWEIWRAARLDRPRGSSICCAGRKRSTRVKTGDKIWRMAADRMMAKYTRNLARIDRDLMPGSYDLAVAARSLADDNYGMKYGRWPIAISVQQTEDPHARDAEHLERGDLAQHQRLRIRRHLPRPKQRLKPAG